MHMPLSIRPVVGRQSSMQNHVLLHCHGCSRIGIADASSPDGAADELVDLRAAGAVLAALPNWGCRLVAGVHKAAPMWDIQRHWHACWVKHVAPSVTHRCDRILLFTGRVCQAPTCRLVCPALSCLLRSPLLPRRLCSCALQEERASGSGPQHAHSIRFLCTVQQVGGFVSFDPHLGESLGDCLALLRAAVPRARGVVCGDTLQAHVPMRRSRPRPCVYCRQQCTPQAWSLAGGGWAVCWAM